MRMSMPTLVIAAGLSLAASSSFAENNNDPSTDINATSVGTRMKNAGDTTNPKSSTADFNINTNSSVGTRMDNAVHDRAAVSNSPNTMSTTTTTNSTTTTNQLGHTPAYNYRTSAPVVVAPVPVVTATSVNAETSRTATMDTSSEANSRTGGAGNSNLTADDQSNNPADVALTRRIRQEVMNRNLSTSAKNVKIITINGQVTLKGEVASANERQSIEEIATQTAGHSNVRDEIMIQK